jgi:regulator of sigma E protease
MLGWRASSLYTIEGVRRKPLGPDAQEWAFRTGLAALLALMISSP